MIDGHNDTLLNLLVPERGGGRDFFRRDSRGHVDLPRMRSGGMAGGFFAMFTPNPDGDEVITFHDRGYEVQLASEVSPGYAEEMTEAMFSLLDDLGRQSSGSVEIIFDTASVRRCLKDGVTFAIPHLEGAEAIAPDLANLEEYYGRGLRSLGPVWSRPNAFGHGVPYAFPSSPDHGPGLTDAGRELVRACNDLGIVLDVSHLNLAGFQDVARVTDSPLVATHSCVHHICPVSRNLTDWQIDAIRDSGGAIGIAFDVSMLRTDGDLNRDTPLPVIADHIDHIAYRAGIDHVAFGSDFDGAVMPTELPDASYLPDLIAALRARGYDDGALGLIARENWLRVLDATWKPTGAEQDRSES